MQQKDLAATVKEYIERVSGLRQLKRLDTVWHYSIITDSEVHKLSVAIFSDASTRHDRGHGNSISGLLIDDLTTGSISHAL